jgi:hypothetical protein
MMVSLRLLQTAGQCPDFLITGVIMDMFLKFAHQIPVGIIAPVLCRVLMLPDSAVQLTVNFAIFYA